MEKDSSSSKEMQTKNILECLFLLLKINVYFAWMWKGNSSRFTNWIALSDETFPRCAILFSSSVHSECSSCSILARLEKITTHQSICDECANSYFFRLSLKNLHRVIPTNVWTHIPYIQHTTYVLIERITQITSHSPFFFRRRYSMLSGRETAHNAMYLCMCVEFIFMPHLNYKWFLQSNCDVHKWRACQSLNVHTSILYGTRCSVCSRAGVRSRIVCAVCVCVSCRYWRSTHAMRSFWVECFLINEMHLVWRCGHSRTHHTQYYTLSMLRYAGRILRGPKPQNMNTIPFWIITIKLRHVLSAVKPQAGHFRSDWVWVCVCDAALPLSAMQTNASSAHAYHTHICVWVCQFVSALIHSVVCRIIALTTQWPLYQLWCINAV